MKKALGFLSLALLLQLATMSTAAAYIDPSGVTYIIQAVAGVVIAGGAAIAIYWRKIRLFFRNRRRP